MNDARLVYQIHKILDGTNVKEDNDYLSILSDWLPLMDLRRFEMIALIKEHPYIPFAHRLFSQGEYIYSNVAGDIYDENGYLFEDWHSEGPGRHDGIRLRAGGAWEHGWRLCIFAQSKLNRRSKSKQPD